MDKYEQQFKKGILEMLVLKLVSQQQAYGYDLILRLRSLGQGLFDLKEGTLYPILYRLEDDGLIRSKKEAAPEGGRGKKYYQITPEGEALAQRLAEYWQVFSACTSQVMQSSEEAAL